MEGKGRGGKVLRSPTSKGREEREEEGKGGGGRKGRGGGRGLGRRGKGDGKGGLGRGPDQVWDVYVDAGPMKYSVGPSAPNRTTSNATLSLAMCHLN